VTLGIQSQRGITRLWLAAILPLWIAGIPIVALCLLVLLLTGPDLVANYGRSPAGDSTLVTTLALTIVSMVLLTAAVLLTRSAGRRWFFRHDNPRQVVLVIVAGVILMPAGVMILAMFL
jgi:hypothetical protein